MGLKSDHLLTNPFVEFQKLGLRGSSSLRAKTLAADIGAPKPPEFVGTKPINCGGARCAANTSSRETFSMLKKSSRAATSLTGMIADRLSFRPARTQTDCGNSPPPFFHHLANVVHVRLIL